MVDVFFSIDILSPTGLCNLLFTFYKKDKFAKKIEAVSKGSLDTFHYSRAFYSAWFSSFFLMKSEKLSRKHYLRDSLNIFIE